MGTISSSSSSMSSPSTVIYVDLYGKRRQVAKIQVIEREIGQLQDEIKSVAELELASRCCKELGDYVDATPDPLIATMNQLRGRSRNLWKNLWRKIGSMLQCCCCNAEVCCSCCLCAKGCCWGGQQKTSSSISCHNTCNCNCNSSCSKCNNPCLCF